MIPMFISPSSTPNRGIGCDQLSKGEIQHEKIPIHRFFFILILIRIEAKVIVVGELTHQTEAPIGQTIQGIITLQNIDEEPEEIKVYQTDYIFFSDGRVLYDEPGKITRSNAPWISVSPKRLTIPAQGIATINYILNVPDDESLEGTYWSIIMIEPVPEGSPESADAKEGELNLGLRQIFRYGIQIVTHIGETGDRSLQFIGSRLVKEEEIRILEIDIENTGERWLRPIVWTELYDEKGIFIGKYDGGILRTYPGTSVKFRMDLTSVESGDYKALVIADGGGNDIFGITFNLILKE